MQLCKSGVWRRRQTKSRKSPFLSMSGRYVGLSKSGVTAAIKVNTHKNCILFVSFTRILLTKPWLTLNLFQTPLMATNIYSFDMQGFIGHYWVIIKIRGIWFKLRASQGRGWTPPANFNLWGIGGETRPRCLLSLFWSLSKESDLYFFPSTGTEP